MFALTGGPQLAVGKSASQGPCAPDTYSFVRQVPIWPHGPAWASGCKPLSQPLEITISDFASYDCIKC